MSTSIKMKSLIKDLCKSELYIDISEIVDYFETKREYDLFCEFLCNFILDDWSRCNDTINIYSSKDKIKCMKSITLMQFLINLYLLEFNFTYRVPVTFDWLPVIDSRFLSNMDEILDDFCKTKIYEKTIEMNLDSRLVLSRFLSNFTEKMEKLSELFSTISAPTISLIDIMDFCKRSTEFDRLLDTTLDDTKSIKELEIQLKNDGNRLVDIIRSDKKSCLYPFIQAKCLNTTQLTQMFVAVGPRMTVSNVVMPHIMTRSYLNGLQNAGDFIAEGEITNKALIYKKKYVGVSGYMSRETNLLCMNLKIDFDCQDCGTVHYVSFDVKDKNYLKQIVNKYQVLPNGELHLITAEDTHLIGNVINIRSIVTCAHDKFGYVCKNCYGKTYEFKKGYSIGGATATEIENKLSNAVMAVKHHAFTDTIEFDNKDVLEYFNLDDSKLYLKSNISKRNTDVYLVFNKEYIEDILDYSSLAYETESEENDDEDDEDVKCLNSKMLNSFKIRIVTFDEILGQTKTVEKDINLDSSFLLLSEEMYKNKYIANKIDMPMDSEYALLNISSMDPGTCVFNIKYITKETSRYLKLLKGIIERPKTMWYHNDYNTPINEFADLIVTANLGKAEMVFYEPVIYYLIKDANNILKRPDFRNHCIDFDVVNLKTGIFKGDLYSTLIYQELTKIFKDIDSFRKVGGGIHDSQFNSSLHYDFDYMKKALKDANIIK